MKRILVALVFLFLPLTVFSCEEAGISYPLISNVSDWEIDNLLDRGEENLLLGEYFQAQEDFCKAISLIENQNNQEIRLCRALFSRSLSNAALRQEENALLDIEHLMKILDHFQCNEAKQGNAYFAHGQPILGPDEMDVSDCIDLVENTIGFVKEILALSPVSNGWKISVIAAIEAAAAKARSCCKSGGIWKACLQPLFEKWLILKDWDKECRKLGNWYFLPPVD